MRKLLLLLCFLWPACVPAQPGAYIRYSTDNGLGSNTIYDVLQDREGFIWASSNSGVYRFDGTHFRRFSTADGLPDNEVLRLYPDHFGRIWFYCFNGKIGYYQDGRFFHPGNTPALAAIAFKDIPLGFYEGRGDVLHIQSGSADYVQLQLSKDGIVSYRRMPSANINWEEGVHNYQVVRGRVYKDDVMTDSLLRPSVARFARDGAFYHIKDNVLLRYRGDSSQELFRWPYAENLAKFRVYSPDHITISDLAHTVLVLRDTGNGFQCIRAFRDTDAPNEAYTDKDGGTWVGSLIDGLFYYPPQGHRHRTSACSPEWPGKIATELNTCEGWLVVGYENGNSALFSKDMKFSRTLLCKDRKFAPVRNIHYSAAYRRLTISSEINFAVWGLDTKGELQWIDSSERFGAKDCEPGPGGRMYAIASNKISGTDITRSVIKIDTLLPERQKRKYAVCPDPVSSTIWFSQIEGLHRLSGGRVAPLFSLHPFLTARITDIKRLDGDQLALATENDGIGIADTSGKIEQIIGPAELHGGLVHKMRLYDGCLWIAGEAGLGAFRREEGVFRPWLWIDRNSGLMSNNVYAFVVDSGYVYISTAAGLQRMDLALLQQKPQHPRLFLHTLSSGKQSWVNPSGRIALPAGCREIRLECSARSFGNTAPVTFAYRFEDADNFIEVTEPSFSIPIGFEGLRRLHLRCRKGSSEWSEEKTLLLDIPVPFYRRPFVQVFFYAGILVLALVISNYFARRRRNRQVRERELKLQVASLEMRALQSMVNPHFVFNVLNSIQHYINENDAYRVNKYLTRFSRLIRSSLHNNRDAMVPLDREIEYIRNYLLLEKLRFGERLRFQVQVDPSIDTAQVLVPGMLVQPLVENAIKHGIVASGSDGCIDVVFRLHDDRLLISVSDDGPGLGTMKPPKSHQSMGLDLIRNRLKLLSEMEGRQYAFRLEKKEKGQGAVATLELPLNYGS